VLPKATDATIIFKVSSPYLTANASGESEDCLRTPAPGRKLLEGTNYTVSTAGAMAFTLKIGDGEAEPGQLYSGATGTFTIDRNAHEVRRHGYYS
jgi:hypothetical protein